MTQISRDHLKYSLIIRKTLPNFFTIGSIICGLAALLMMTNFRFIAATFLVLLAMVLDSLDGRTARLLNGMSPFGAQMDSLADMVSFGVVPAFTVILTLYGITKEAQTSFIVGCCYAVAVAIRLARFNCRLGVSDQNYFEGLPCPAAAGLVMLVATNLTEIDLVLFALPHSVLTVARSIMGVTLLVSVLMVSNIPFYNFKHVRWTKPKIIGLVLALGLVVSYLMFSWEANFLLATTVKMAFFIMLVLAMYILLALLSWPVRNYIHKHYVPKDC